MVGGERTGEEPREFINYMTEMRMLSVPGLEDRDKILNGGDNSERGYCKTQIIST